MLFSKFQFLSSIHFPRLKFLIELLFLIAIVCKSTDCLHAWTPATAGSPIRKVHVDELRAAIDSIRREFGFSTVGWTDPVIEPGVTRIRKVHVEQLRTAITQVRNVYYRPPPVFSDDPILSGVTTIRATHIAELQNAVDGVTGGCRATCGPCRFCQYLGCNTQAAGSDTYNDCSVTGPNDTPPCQTGDCDGAGGCRTNAITCYQDADGDGFSPTPNTPVIFCGDTCPAGTTATPKVASNGNNVDCYDTPKDSEGKTTLANAVYPLSPAWSTTQRGDGGWDFDCNNDISYSIDVWATEDYPCDGNHSCISNHHEPSQCGRGFNKSTDNWPNSCYSGPFPNNVGCNGAYQGGKNLGSLIGWIGKRGGFVGQTMQCK